MGLPAKLKDVNLFNDGESYIGKVPEFTLPKLTRKLEDYRGGGMLGDVKIDLGQESLECEWKTGGLVKDIFKQYGITSIDGLQLRFLAAYQADDTAEVNAVEVVIRGRHQEIDMGNSKPGDNSDMTMKTIPVYYRLIIDGEDVIEIDMLNGVLIVGGVDRQAELRAAIGA